MKSFNQFYEQAAAAAPAAPKPAAKVQSKAKPKVTDPSTGVDIDDKGRWEGQIVDQGKELEPEQKIKIKDGRKGPDPNLPTGEANPNKKKKDYEIAGIWQSPDGTYYSRPPVSKPDTSKWPSIHDKPKPVKWPTPGIFPGQLPKVQKEPTTTIAAGGNPRGTGGKSAGDPANIKWPRDRPGGARPGPGYRPPTA